jgi:hypothetical protein
MLSDNTEQFVEALRLDVGKPRQEALSGEVSLTLQDVINVVKNVYPYTPLLT